jgi:hypothetical protein
MQVFSDGLRRCKRAKDHGVKSPVGVGVLMTAFRPLP